MNRISLGLRTIALGVAAAITYGIVHDQISIRISPPYLGAWHPQIVESDDPTLVALAWGVVATWWFGLILGGVLALAATLGVRPPAAWRIVMRATAFVFILAAVAATVASLVFAYGRIELPNLFGEVYGDLDREGRLSFSKVAAMHEASYDGAGVAAFLAAAYVWRSRKAIHAKENPAEESAGQMGSEAKPKESASGFGERQG